MIFSPQFPIAHTPHIRYAAILCKEASIAMTLSELPIPIDRERIAAFCKERGIRKPSKKTSYNLQLYPLGKRNTTSPKSTSQPVAVVGIGKHRQHPGGEHLRQVIRH